LIQKGRLKKIPIYNNKVVLIAEIPLKKIYSESQNYNKLKKWVKETYTTDIIHTSINYDNAEERVSIKSKVELLLPLLNTRNEGTKSVMSYELNTIILHGKCVFEVSNISYKIQKATPEIKNRISAREFITASALDIQDDYTQVRNETQKGTLYFLNNLIESLEVSLNKVE
jgi:hypothetical protein